VNLLLDTHVFLWWDRQDNHLNPDTRALIADPGNRIFVSAASVWEITIKRRLGKLDMRGSAVAAIGNNGFHELPILPIDAERAGALPWRHNDPFDRMLIAQAKRLTFKLATADAAIRAYDGVALLWAG
jgi:PIN domain nuclease of toxin-antitoxin system